MAYPLPRPRRPIGVAILAILVILGGVILTLLALLAIAAALILAPIILGVAIIFLILSLILLAAGIGLWNLRPWAWWLAVIVVVLQVARAVVATDWSQGIANVGLVSLALPGLILIYLLAVRGSFRSQPA